MKANISKFNPIQYMAIDVANCCGFDKLSWQARIDWVKANENSLEDHIPDDPKTKFLAIKAISAFRNARNGIPVNHIMSLDASNSGVQIMSVLAKCMQSAKTCNVVDTGSREDLYGAIMAKIEIDGISRQEVKDAIIPMLYGSINSPRELFGEDTPELEAFVNAVEETVPALGDCRELLTSCWDSTATEHSFTMLDGHYVYLPVLTKAEYKIEVEEWGSSFTFITEEKEPSKSPTSILANVIHATDAYVCREMIRRSHTQGFKLAVIHDAFFASPVHMQQVREMYVEILAEIAKSNLLEDIMSQLTGEEEELEFESPDLWKSILTTEYALS